MKILCRFKLVPSAHESFRPNDNKIAACFPPGQFASACEPAGLQGLAVQRFSTRHADKMANKALDCLQSAFSVEVSRVIIPSKRVRKTWRLNEKKLGRDEKRRFSSRVLPSRLVPILLAVLVLISCPARSF